MLFALLIIAAAIACFFLVVGIAIGNQGREQLRLEIASLRERLAESEGRYQESRRITGELLKLAQEKYFPQQSITTKQHEQLESQFDFKSVAPTYIAPTVKNCPQCSVSVRADSWPQECPACHCVFGFGEGS